MSIRHRFSTWFVAFAAAMIAAAGPSVAKGACRPVEAQMSARADPDACEAPQFFCAAGIISRDNVIGGQTHWGLLGFAPGAGLEPILPPETGSYTGERTIVTRLGTLKLRIVGVFDSVTGEFADYQQITSGTGRFRNATGTLFMTGLFSAESATFAADVTGTICAAR